MRPNLARDVYGAPTSAYGRAPVKRRKNGKRMKYRSSYAMPAQINASNPLVIATEAAVTAMRADQERVHAITCTKSNRCDPLCDGIHYARMPDASKKNGAKYVSKMPATRKASPQEQRDSARRAGTIGSR